MFKKTDWVIKLDSPLSYCYGKCMRRGLFLSSLVVGMTVLIYSLLVTPAFAQTVNVSSGPVSKYLFKASASWMMGKINLTYYNDGSADKFSLLYGTRLGVYQFGALNLPAAQYAKNKFTVDFLRSDSRYYFALIAEKNGQFVYMTQPVAAISN